MTSKSLLAPPDALVYRIDGVLEVLLPHLNTFHGQVPRFGRVFVVLVRLDGLLHISYDLLLQRLPHGLVRSFDVLEVLQVLI